MSAVRVDVWSDVACPWCWVGKRNLARAASEAGVEVELHWHAFELDPSAPKSLPEGGLSLVQRLAQKYGVSEPQAQQMIDRMTAVGASVGLEFRFERVVPTSTFDAHRLLAWAAGKGKQDALAERLFEAYMHEGERVSDPEVLVRAVEAVGLDADAAQAVLSGDDYSREVRNDRTEASQMGVTGVPFFVFDGKYAAAGAQPPDVLAKVLTRVVEERPVLVTEGEVCGPDGCVLPEPG